MTDPRWPEMAVGAPRPYLPEEYGAESWVCTIHTADRRRDALGEVYAPTPAQALSRARAVAALGEMEALVAEAARCRFGRGCGSVALWDFRDRARALLARLEADE